MDNNIDILGWEQANHGPLRLALLGFVSYSAGPDTYYLLPGQVLPFSSWTEMYTACRNIRYHMLQFTVRKSGDLASKAASMTLNTRFTITPDSCAGHMGSGLQQESLEYESVLLLARKTTKLSAYRCWDNLLPSFYVETFDDVITNDTEWMHDIHSGDLIPVRKVSGHVFFLRGIASQDRDYLRQCGGPKRNGKEKKVLKRSWVDTCELVNGKFVPPDATFYIGAPTDQTFKDQDRKCIDPGGWSELAKLQFKAECFPMVNGDDKDKEKLDAELNESAVRNMEAVIVSVCKAEAEYK